MDIIKNVSILTTVPEASIRKLFEKAEWSICDAVSSNPGCPNFTFSIGFGDIQIINLDEQIVYKFIPSKKFEAAVRSGIVDGINPLKKTLETTLVNKILNTYKDIF